MNYLKGINFTIDKLNWFFVNANWLFINSTGLEPAWDKIFQFGKRRGTR